MNNLLRTLTENQARPSSDLKLLLNTVKDVRRQAFDAKASDPFYDSLEGLLHDLRTVTMDNHDAEVFLRPVSKSDVPDYYDVIPNPMDLQTMLKKVKAKQYKSKREFNDDLDLIWSNCFTYNATEDHPLRLCAKRLKRKADRLLMNITDRKDRVDPPIPGDGALATTNRPIARPKLNGVTHSNQDLDHDRIPSRSRQHSPSPSSTAHTPSATPSTNGRPLSMMSRLSMSTADSRQRKNMPFAESPALIRTPENMATFRDLDRGLAQILDLDPSFQSGEPGPSTLSYAKTVAARLRQYSVPGLDVRNGDVIVKTETQMDTGEKRKLSASCHRSKRPRLTPPDSSDEIDTGVVAHNVDKMTDLWWDAVQSDSLLANGLPCLPSIPSFPPPIRPLRNPLDPRPIVSGCSVCQVTVAPPSPKKRLRARPTSRAQSGSLLMLMNSNIKTLKRVRRTHAKFAALGLGGGGEDGAAAVAGGGGVGAASSAVAGTAGASLSMMLDREAIIDPDTEGLEDVVDERPWLARLRSTRGRGKEKEKEKEMNGLEIGERAAGSCLKWMNREVLEHVGFQGTSAGALDVLTSVASEFLLSVGQTLRFLCDKYSRTMTPEELILHALFESGITRIEDLEQYIKDDVVRHGARLAELEKKLVGAYREATSIEVPDDDALFNSDQEEDDALAMGTFADALGEDFLGLRELGIAAELGLSSLSVPRRLLKGKRDTAGGVITKPTEALPPYPPPPPFLPITSKNIENQIGLLRPFYEQRLASLAVTSPMANMPGVAGPSGPAGLHNPSMPTLPGPSFPPLPQGAGLAAPSLFSLVPMPQNLSSTPLLCTEVLISLPEDPPNPSQTKVGPTGHIITQNLTTAGTKKKAKGKESGGGAGAGLSGGGGGGVMAQQSGVVDGGEGGGVNGKGGGVSSPKKKAKVADLPPVIAASA